MDQMIERFSSLIEKHGVHGSVQTTNQLQKYFELLVSWNEKMNLTAITDREEVYIKHFYDSLSLSFFFDLSKVRSIADIGAGAGFPSLPLKIFYPHLEVTIVDSLNKRITFLTELVSELGLNHVNLVHGRAEDIAHKADYREKFELVTARAVARLNVLCEFCLPFASVGGHFIAMKGAKALEEIDEARKAIQQMGGKLTETHSFELPQEESKRFITIMNKISPTPRKFPRKAGTPLKNPII